MSANKRPAKDPDLLGRFWNDLVLSWRLVFDRRVAGTVKLIPLAMLAYILSPIDLIPDLFVPFGVVDDLGALLLGLQLFIHSAPPGVVDEYRGRVRRAPRGDRVKAAPDEPKVIEGKYEVWDDDE
ncbi:MAG: DUF1232 domain-containing protein [Anaerolineae bacterium]|jgi:uncharacterized membrane protein YkvA (DUF1232 family)|nr:DUF1232 domain-containing protein [Anaerolineae bacterium]